jgi:hypothetical protein
MSYLIDIYPNIIVDRNGISKDSYMKTISIVDEILCGLSYKVTINGVELLLRSNPVHQVYQKERKIDIPKYLEFFGEWQSNRKIQIDHKDANILGEFSKFEIDLNKMNIPIQDATSENLEYYNVKLLKIDDKIKITREEDRINDLIILREQTTHLQFFAYKSLNNPNNFNINNSK